MNARSCFFFVCALLVFSCSTFASNGTLSFTQSTDGGVFAVYNSGPCLLGLYPSQQVAPIATVSGNEVDISSFGGVAGDFGSDQPPCNPQLSPGFFLPADLGKLPDGHYAVVWSFFPEQVAGAFDVASGSLVNHAARLSNPTAASGLWQDSSYVGEGFNLLVASSGLLVTFYGWNESGERLWLTSSTGPASFALNTPVVLNMTYTTGGTFDSPQLNVAQWGSLVLNFTSCQTAQATLSGKDGIQNLNLSQVTGIAGLFECECGVRRLPFCFGRAFGRSVTSGE